MEWPMLLRYAGETELRVIRTQDEWQIDPELHARRYGPEDRLIDSEGVEYRLLPNGSRNEMVATGRRYSADEFIALAATHIRAAGAEPEWLAGHLRGIAEAHKIRATILYLSKLAAADVAEGSDEEE
jgi:protein structure with unknown function